MDRDELTALHNALATVVRGPDAVRVQVAQWLASEVAKPNGHDPRPPERDSQPPVLTPPRVEAKVQAARPVKPAPAQAADSGGDAGQSRSERARSRKRRRRFPIGDWRAVAATRSARGGRERSRRPMAREGSGGALRRRRLNDGGGDT